jgi:hypothetical protein
MADKIQFRRDTKARWAQFNPILMEGELGFETDTDQYKLGNGTSAWNDLPYRGMDAVDELGDSTTLIVNQRTTTKVDRESQKNAGVIIAGSVNLKANALIGSVIVDIAIFGLPDDSWFVGVEAMENGIKYLSGQAGEYRRYGFSFGLWQWQEDGSIIRSVHEWDSFWITRPVGSTDYDTWSKTGVEKVLTKRNNILIIDWDAMNVAIPPSTQTQVGSGASDMRYCKINPSKYYKLKGYEINKVNLFLPQFGISAEKKNYQVGINQSTGAVNAGNNTIRIPVGETGNGSNIGANFTWSNTVDMTQQPYPKDVYFAVTFKILKGDTPFSVLGVLSGNQGNSTPTPSFLKRTDNPDGTIKLEGIFQDIRTLYTLGTSVYGVYLGYQFSNNVVSGEDFEMQLLNAEITYTTYPEYTGSSGSRIEMERYVDTSVKDAVVFNPILTTDDYNAWATVEKGLASVPMEPYTTEEGYKAGRLPINTNCRNYWFGLQNTLKAGTKYKCDIIVQATGIDWSNYSMYTVINGTSNFSTVKRTTIDAENGIYQFSYSDAVASDADRTFIMAIQQTKDFTQVVEGNVIIKEVSVNAPVSDDTLLENTITKQIVNYINKLNIPEPLKVYQSNYRLDLYKGAIKLPDGDGFFVPVNTETKPSNMFCTLSGFKLENKVDCEIYFYKDNDDFVVDTFFITTDKNGANRRVLYVTPIKVADGLYKCVYSYTPSASTNNDSESIQFAVQNVTVGQLLPLSTTLQWKSASYSQYFKGEYGDMGFEQYAIQKTAEDVVTSALKTDGVTEIVVTANENAEGYEFKGMNAVQLALNSITDASALKRYRIYVMPGLYKITNSSQFIGNIGYPAMICMKDYVDVVGHSKDSVIFWAELPYNDADIDTSVSRNLHQTVWNWATEAHMKNCTLVAKNIRYTIHQDDGRSAMKARYYENVDLIFIGDKGSQTCWGLGSWNGEENYVKGGKCMAVYGNPWSCHNNTNFKYPTKWSFEDHQFFAAENTTAIVPQNDGSLLNDILKLVGCGFGGKAYVVNYNQFWLKGGQYASFNHAEWRLFGHSNQPFLFSNSVRGYSLRVTSKSKGDNSVVRFDDTSSAFDDLIRNPRYPDNTHIAIPEFEIINGYLIKDGSAGLSGWANGCRDLSGEAYGYDNGVVLDSLGKNLGDCSTNNKILTINVDGTDYNITFNKNYTNMDNATILAEINAVIGTVATAELYSVGQEYFPEMSDVMEHVLNASTTEPIMRGTVVTMTTNGRVKPCAEGEKIFGVALDDIPVYSITQGVVKGYGRIMKRGYIYTSGVGYKHFVRATSKPEVGTRMKVVDGQLVADQNGECVGRDSGVISINC